MNDALELDGDDVFEMTTAVDINIIMLREEIELEKDP